MIFSIKILAVMMVIFLADINISFAASECYEINRKVCNWELAHAGNGIEHRQSISDMYDCELNEQQYSDKMFKIHNDESSKISYSEIDNKIKFYQEEVSSYKSLGLSFDRQKLQLCFWQEEKKYYQQGSKANTSSNQTSSSGSSSQANNKASRQGTASQSNQGSSENQLSSSNSGNQSNQQSGSNTTNSNSGSNMRPEQAELVNEAAQTYATKTAAFEESHKGLKRTHNKANEASRCIKLENKNIKNICDYRVEYVFCATQPIESAGVFEMASAFDCDHGQKGMAGISGKTKHAGSFSAKTVYVFGCKSPSIPMASYERGRGLAGWCE